MTQREKRAILQTPPGHLFSGLLNDYQSHPVRAVLETGGMILGVFGALVLAATTPAPSLLVVYVSWLISAVLLGACSYHRGSFGLTVNYGCYVLINTGGLLHLWGIL